ncbi:MAG: MoxR family ATPase [Pyrinomonadaceae bacterium]
MSEPEYTGTATDFYVAPPDVADKVNLAVALNRPVLIEGEPGCGKTMLAYSVAAEKGLGRPVKIAVKSTSRAQDLLYRVNALRRLQDAQRQNNERAEFSYPYLSLGPLGRAIQEGRRAVVLIDEVDKADIDFPNDLLDVLDDFTFQIEDLPEEEEVRCLAEKGFGRTVSVGEGGQRPIVFITSNREKRLPEPFLRRCLYVRLRFPDTAEELTEIVLKNTRETAVEINRGLLDAAVAAFRRVRTAAVGTAQKPPTTSELIDWVKILHWREAAPDQLKGDTLLPPYWELLFKNMADLDAHKTLAEARQKQTAG